MFENGPENVGGGLGGDRTNKRRLRERDGGDQQGGNSKSFESGHRNILWVNGGLHDHR